MNNKGYTGKELLIVFAVMGIFTFAVIGFTSNAYVDNSESYYNEIIHAIEKQACLYGENSETLKSEGNLVITVDELVDAGYFVANEDGKVEDPSNTKHSLNNMKIKLSYDEETGVKAEVFDE